MTGPADETWAMGRGWRRVLIGSLAVNLLIIGLVIGAVAGGGPGGRFSGFDLATGPLVDALSDDDRRAIRQALRDTARPRGFGALQGERQAIFMALRAAPFDPGPVNAALDSMRSRFDAVTRLAQEALVARIAGMAPADRAAFADRLEQALREGPGRGG